MRQAALIIYQELSLSSSLRDLWDQGGSKICFVESNTRGRGHKRRRKYT